MRACVRACVHVRMTRVPDSVEAARALAVRPLRNDVSPTCMSLTMRAWGACMCTRNCAGWMRARAPAAVVPRNQSMNMGRPPPTVHHHHDHRHLQLPWPSLRLNTAASAAGCWSLDDVITNVPMLQRCRPHGSNTCLYTCLSSCPCAPSRKSLRLRRHASARTLAGSTAAAPASCVHPCVRVCMRVCAHVCACMHACVRASAHACVRADGRACVRACVRACSAVQCMHACLFFATTNNTTDIDGCECNDSRGY